MPPWRPLFRVFCLAALLLTARSAHSIPVPSIGNPSLAVVDGRPAIAGLSNGNGVTDFTRTIKYVRALDAAGTAWGTPVTLYTGTDFLFKLSLRVANGRPAVCFSEGATLRFILANDAAGDSWAPVRTLLTGSYNFSGALEVIDGNFAILALNGGKLFYLRAMDPAAANWTPGVQVSTRTGTGEYSLAEIQGRPAAVFVSNSGSIGGTWYTRGLDASGTAWSPEVRANTETSVVCLSLKSAGGNPAFTFHRYTGGNNQPGGGPALANLMYACARNPDASSWTAVTLGRDVFYQQTMGSPLAVVNGSPAVSFVTLLDNTITLNYIRANDSTGVEWNAPVHIGPGGLFGNAPSLAEVGGRPAIASYFAYQRGEDAGGVLWPPDIHMRFGSVVVADGSGFSLGTVAVGTAGTFLLNVLNPRSSSTPLSITGVTLEGPDAAEFSILQSPSAPVPGGGSADMVVRYAPVTPGIKTARLYITSNVGFLFDIGLEGRSVPELTVETYNGHPLYSGGPSVRIPWTSPGTPASIVLIVRNPGGAELNGVTATISSGPYSDEFTVTAPPASVVAPGGSTSLTVRHLAQTAGDKYGSLRLNSNAATVPYRVNLIVVRGGVDESFDPSIAGTCTSIAVEPGGRILAGGAELIPSNNGFIGAFHPDGTADTSFFPPPLSNTLDCIAVLRDSRILLGGGFGLKRIFPDGTLDATFTPGLSGGVTCLAIQPDGRIVAGGYLSGGASRNLIRLHPDGMVDTTFNAVLDSSLDALIPLPNGQWLAGGWFRGPAPVKPYLARFNHDGTYDPVSWQVSQVVYALAGRLDGLVFAGTSSGLVRLQPDGTLASGSPVVAGGSPWGLTMQANGECVGGNATALFRIRADGTREANAFRDTPSGGGVSEAVLQADGKVLIGGGFTIVGDFNGPSLARFTNDPAFSSLNRDGSTAVRWMRGGTAPEVSDVSFEMNTPGGNAWTLLGWGTRIPGGWRLTGLDLPDACQIRARGRAGGSLLQATASFPVSALEASRLQFFGTPENTGDAANDADPDLDDLPNVVEFAFGTSPVDGRSRALPEFRLTGEDYTAMFTAPEGREDVIYGAEWSPTMQPHTWTAIPDTGTDSMHTFRAPGGEGRVFARFLVRMQ